jgi:hypothetical protein
MMDLQTIVIAIARLSSEDFDTLRVRMNEMERERYQSRMNEEDPEVWINDLHAAIAEFREGLTDDRITEIVNDMNFGYVSPKELAILEQLSPFEGDES